MDFIPVDFTPRESLEILQYQNPKYWKVDIIPFRTELHLCMINHKVGPSCALRQCITKQKNMADAIILLAAYQHLMNEKLKEYHHVLNQIAQIEKQQGHLSKSRLISTKDRSELNLFYTKRLTELNKRKKALLQSKEVCHELQVEYDTITSKTSIS